MVKLFQLVAWHVVINGFVEAKTVDSQTTPVFSDVYDDLLKEFMRNQIIPHGYNKGISPTYAYYPHYINSTDPLKSAGLENYSSSLTPWVKLIIEPFFITSISLKTMDMTVEVNLELSWEDSRLAKLSDDLAKFHVGELNLKYYSLPHFPEIIAIWTPDIKFSNCKAAEPLLTHKQQLENSNIRYNPWLKRLTVEYRKMYDFLCSFVLTMYPFDVQTCKMVLLFEHSNKKINWIPVKVIEALNHIHVPPEFDVISFVVQKCPTVITAESNVIECAEYVFTFQRIYAQHIMLLFIPSILIVTLSWISFWLEEAAAAPRVTLGLTSLLTLATQFNNAQKDLPAVADIKALDIWMFACLLMVFASLLEFAVANLSHRSQRSSILPVRAPKYVTLVGKTANTRKMVSVPFKRSPYFIKRRPPKIFKYCCCSSHRRKSIDRAARIVFPSCFLVFNIVFWSYYTT